MASPGPSPDGPTPPTVREPDHHEQDLHELDQRQDPPQGSAEGLQPPKGKEKKKVGFVGDSQPEDGPLGSPLALTPNETQGLGPDYFSYTPSPSNCSTPVHDGDHRRPAFDDTELFAAVAEYFEREHPGSAAGPSRPRPVLRKPSAAPAQDADGVSTTPHRSELEAKDRADRLAYSVGTSSVPVSRRASLDSDHGDADQETLLGSRATTTQDFEAPGDSENLRARKRAHMEADQLVRRHTHRKSPLMHSFRPPRSGATTPVEDDLEYVPRPDNYKGGVLGTLLKLYGAEDKYGSPQTDLSALSTPSSSPPTSRPGTPKFDPRRRGRRTQSQSTLAGLMESSFMFAAPGSARDISEAMSEKVKQEASKPKKSHRSKKKAEEFRIKIHIAEIINRHTYLIKLCRALMTYGAPTHRLEAYMRMSARVLGIEGQFLYLPDTMIISFDDSNTHTTEVKILRAGQGLDFGRLRDVHEIYKEVVHDRMGVDEATPLLDEITARKPKYPVWLRILLYGVASACVAPFGFEGRYIDMPICFILGCLVGFLQLYISPSNELYANVFEITAAIATSFLARVFGSIRDGQLFCFSSLAQASIALILPGYMVLCASLELQSHQMISGSVRMVYALIYTLFLGYGFTIGSVIYGYMDSNAVSEVHCSVGDTWYTQRPPQDYYILFVLPFTLCLCAINQAKWKQTPVQVFISLAGYCVNNFSSRFFRGNGIVSSSLGALTIGVLANLYSRLGRYAQNSLLDLWERHLEPRLSRRHRGSHLHSSPYQTTPGDDSDETISPSTTTKTPADPELGPTPPSPPRRARKIGYGLAAAAMLPAIFVQVPSGLAASGSLLSGVTSADQIVRNETAAAGAAATAAGDLNNPAFGVMFSVVQVAVNISVGLSLSALLVYPFGKRRSGLFSF